MKSAIEKILTRIRNKGGGFVFSSKDFLDLGTRGSVDVALSNLTKDGRIRRLARGLYDYPKHSDLLAGPLSPDFDAVAQAVARKTGARIQPSPAVAANLLGLSEQVPAKVVYLTSGTSRTFAFAHQSITFVHARMRDLLDDPLSATVVQALMYLGRDGITPGVIQILGRRLKLTQKKRLAKQARFVADWVADAVRKIVLESSE